ncbi:MAG: TonB family protein [Candidatus Aminicenantes bacterium]|nr:TonB family protein [Candidatus Aminicenantes bacterium]
MRHDFRRLIILGLCLSITAVALLPAQESLLQVRAFLITEPSGKSRTSPVEFLAAVSDPRLAPLKSAVNGSESDLRSAAIRAIPGIREIESAESLFSLIFFWDGQALALSDFVIQPPAALRFEITPAWRFDGALSFKLALYAKEISPWPIAGSKEESAAVRSLRAAVHPDFFKSRMEKLLEKEVALAVEEPGLLFLPFNSKTIVLLLMPASRPQPILQALPIYPDDLIRQGIAGQGRYRVSIDEKGKVRNVAVKTSVHPFLDDAAIQAIRQWTFEPVLKGFKASAASFDWTVDFDPARWPVTAARPQAGALEPYSPELKKILLLGASYCRRLSEAALDFVCQESIRSIDCALHLPEKTVAEEIKTTTKPTGGGEFIAIANRRASLSRDPFKTKTYRFSSDFQMIRKEGRTTERRALLESNVKKAAKGAGLPDEKRYASLKPLFAPLDVLAADRQESYDFRLLGQERIRGRSVAVIEATARSGAASRIPAAKIWIDSETSQILRCETQGLPVEGYEFVFEEASRIGLSPLGTMTADYEEEKNGVLFPSRVSLLIEYLVPQWGVGKRVRVDTQIRYDKYRFFTVDTEHAIIKF